MYTTAKSKPRTVLTYPIRLCGAPLYLVDLSLCGCVGEDGVLNGPRHLLDVPDEGLVVVPGCADVAGRVRRPGYPVHACAMVVQPTQNNTHMVEHYTKTQCCVTDP
jgi:hypothetical protein